MKGEGYDAEAIEGAKSQFDVIADGSLLFSKEAEGRFPDAAEVLGALKAA